MGHSDGPTAPWSGLTCRRCRDGPCEQRGCSGLGCDDGIVSVGQYRTEEEATAPYIGLSSPPPRSAEEAAEPFSASVAAGLRCHPVVGGFKNPFGPIAVSRDGAAIGITSASNDVAVLDAATLRRRFPDVEIRPAFIIAMAISDDGSKVAVGCDDHGQRGGMASDPIFVVDMKSGVARPLRPDCHTLAKSVAVIAAGSLAAAASIWLLWRTRPRAGGAPT